MSRGCLQVNHQLKRRESIFLVVRDFLVHDLCLLQIKYQCLADVLELVAPRRREVVQKPHSSGGSVLLFVERESGNVWFPSRCSRARDPLFCLCKQSQPVGDSEHVFVYPVYQLSILVVPLDRLLRCDLAVLSLWLSENACTSPTRQAKSIASPVVLGFAAIVLVLLCLMSWDQFHMHGVRTPGNRDEPFHRKAYRSPSIDPAAW